MWGFGLIEKSCPHKMSYNRKSGESDHGLDCKCKLDSCLLGSGYSA